MSVDVAIKVENLTKIFKLYSSPMDRLKDIVFPGTYHKNFYALNDISFEIKKGESVGIIGRNGSGKSTLLKLITGVQTPTRGSVVVNGRMSTLLELGAGFNPELTGIENVYFNGILMGYKREEIDAKVDRILAFADLGNFIDQPVKLYSSGMFVRLAFSVQALVEPDILIIDEALAVGDSLFQKRCFEKMEELIAAGTTLLFVSHDQESIRTLTTRALLLKDGRVHKSGTSSDVVLEYRRLLHEEESMQSARQDNEASRKKQNFVSLRSDQMTFGDGDAELLEVNVLNGQGERNNFFHPGDLLRISLKFKVNVDLTHLNVGLRIRNKQGIKIYSWGTLNQDMAILANLRDGEIFWERRFSAAQIEEVIFECRCPLGENFYEIQTTITQERNPYYGDQRMLQWRDEAAFFTVAMEKDKLFFGGVADLNMKALW